MSYQITNLIMNPALNNTISTSFNYALAVIVVNTDNNGRGTTESVTKQNVLSFVNKFCSTAEMPYLRFFYEKYDYDDLTIQIDGSINENTSSVTNNGSSNGTISGTEGYTQTYITNIRSSILYMLTTNIDQLNFIRDKIQVYITS